MFLATDVIHGNNFFKVNATQYTGINAYSYKLIMYIQ